MKKLSNFVPSPAFAHRTFKSILTALALLCVVANVQAQIQINLGINPTITFDASPTLTADLWATLAAGVGAAGAGTYDNAGDVDAGAQTVDQSTINLELPRITGNGTSGSARHNTTAGYLVTQPTGVASAVLKATLRNVSGGDINALTVAYSYTIPVTPVTDSVPGQRVFWSLTGLPNSWTPIPNLSGKTVAANLSATLSLGVWANGTDMYIMWLDDNNENGTDGAFTIDNLVFDAAVVSAITITNDPDSITVPERGAATFTVEASGFPLEYHWLRDGVPIPGANGQSYTLNSALPADSGAVFSVIVSNSVNSPTSAGATLTVTPDTTAPTALSAISSPDRASVTITFSEPVVTFDAGSFLYFPNGTDPQMTGVNAEGFVVNGSNIVFTFPTAPLMDGVNYSVQVYDVFDTAVDNAHLIEPYPSTLPLRRSLNLIETNGVWKYSIETNLFGTGWETTGYDDSDPVAWPSGPAALGINTDANPNSVPILTPTTYAGNSAPQFFRRHFFLPSATNGVELFMRHLFEDGAVVFINGQEAGRYNVGPGALSVTTRSTANFTENTPLPAPVPLPLTNVFPGDNVIAVVVIQSGTGSSDSIMALELRADFDEFASGPPFIQADPQSQTVSEGGTASFSVSVKGALPLNFQWRKGGSPISGATNQTYSIIGVVPADAGNYDVVVNNTLGTSNSAIAVLTVTADITDPVLLSAIGSTNLSQVVVTIYDAGGLNLTSAQTPSNYQIHLTGGGGDLTVVSATVTNVGTNTVITLTTSTPRTADGNYTVVVNVVDRSVAANPTTPNSAPIVASVVLFSFNSTWRYDQSGTDLGTAWKETLYNDTAWPSGPGVLAFETTAGVVTFLTPLAPPAGTNTVLSLTNSTGAGLGGTNITFYFRTTVDISSFNPAAATLTMRGYIDDGAIIYVNGTERLRINHSNAPTYLSLADNGSAESVLIVSNLTGFVQGNNVIAVEVHQTSMDSSDIAWGMQLEASVTSFSPGGPRLFTERNGNNLTITWSGGGTLQRSSDISSPANWENIIGASSPFQTNTTATALQFFRVTVP